MPVPEIWLEAESAQVGRCRIPGICFSRCKQRRCLKFDSLPRNGCAIGGPSATKVDNSWRMPRSASAVARAAAHPTRPRSHCVSGLGNGMRAMLDYYDRCYDHELERAEEQRPSISLASIPNNPPISCCAIN